MPLTPTAYQIALYYSIGKFAPRYLYDISFEKEEKKAPIKGRKSIPLIAKLDRNPERDDEDIPQKGNSRIGHVKIVMTSKE